jgi:hypothetical protein
MDERPSLIRRLGLVLGSAVFLALLVVGLHLAIAARAGGGGGLPGQAGPIRTPPPTSTDVVPSSQTTSAKAATRQAPLACPDDVLCSDATTCTTVDDNSGQAADSQAADSQAADSQAADSQAADSQAAGSESCTGQTDCSPAATSDVPPESGVACPGDDSSG